MGTQKFNLIYNIANRLFYGSYTGIDNLFWFLPWQNPSPWCNDCRRRRSYLFWIVKISNFFFMNIGSDERIKFFTTIVIRNHWCFVFDRCRLQCIMRRNKLPFSVEFNIVQRIYRFFHPSYTMPIVIVSHDHRVPCVVFKNGRNPFGETVIFRPENTIRESLFYHTRNTISMENLGMIKNKLKKPKKMFYARR